MLVRAPKKFSLLLWLGWSLSASGALCPEVITQAFTSSRPLTLVLSQGTEVEVEFLGFSPAQVASSYFSDRIRVQVEEVERFLNELSADYPLGQCPICQVHIRPGSVLDLAGGRQLLWHGGNKITVRVPVVPFLGARPLDNDGLRIRWNRGRHHSTPSLVSRRWEYLNPAGPVRLELRRSTEEALARLRGRLAEVAARVEETGAGTASEIASIVRSHAGEGGALSEAARGALSRVSGLGAEAQRRLLHLLDGALADPSYVGRVESALEQSLHGAPGQGTEAPSSSTALSLGVSVSNAHDIRVRVSVVNGELRSETGTPRAPLRTFSLGLLVAVATSDRIEVELGVERAAVALALDRALREFAGETQP